jgi:hypothetical protein
MASSMTDSTGRVGVVMPQGALFRGGVEHFYRRVDRGHQQSAAGRLEALLQRVDDPAVAGGVAGGEASEGHRRGCRLTHHTPGDLGRYDHEANGRARIVAECGGLENR